MSPEETQFDYKIFVHFSVEVHYWQIIAANGQFLPKTRKQKPISVLYGIAEYRVGGGPNRFASGALGVGGLSCKS